MSYHAVIFDCDGVLVDSETLSALVFRDMAEGYKVYFDEVEALDFIRGRKVGEWMAELQSLAPEPLPGDIVTQFRQRTAEAFAQSLRAVPHVETVVRGLDRPFCTASSAPREKIALTLGLTGLLPLFEGRIFSAYEVGSWKPDPGLFLHAAAAMDVQPDRCVVIEDSLVGVRAGVAAGMTVLAYASLERHAALTAAGARAFTSMLDVPGLLEAMRH